MDLNRLEVEQYRLNKKIILNDDFAEIKTIAGCDVTYTENTIVCCFVVMDYPSLNIREVKVNSDKTRFPYIPGFLSYRESPIIIDTYHSLELDPDLIIVDGNGILHPRGMGVASHIGLSLDKPTIGVAKSLLCGDEKGKFVFMGNDKKAVLLKTRDKAKPIYISQGHKISSDSMIQIAKATLKGHKLPEPLHAAHKYTSKEKRRLKVEHR